MTGFMENLQTILESVRLSLGNLLSNAVKFSHAGGTVKLKAENEGNRSQIPVGTGEEQGRGLQAALWLPLAAEQEGVNER